MPEYDTCYFWGDEGCTFDGDCPYRDKDYNCDAEDEDLLTYEDYQQRVEIVRQSAKFVQDSTRGKT